MELILRSFFALECVSFLLICLIFEVVYLAIIIWRFSLVLHVTPHLDTWMGTAVLVLIWTTFVYNNSRHSFDLTLSNLLGVSCWFLSVSEELLFDWYDRQVIVLLLSYPLSFIYHLFSTIVNSFVFSLLYFGMFWDFSADSLVADDSKKTFE